MALIDHEALGMVCEVGHFHQKQYLASSNLYFKNSRDLGFSYLSSQLRCWTSITKGEWAFLVWRRMGCRNYQICTTILYVHLACDAFPLLFPSPMHQ